jgi:hypothetical protein
MSTPVNEALRRVGEEVLESLAFVLPAFEEPAPEGEPAGDAALTGRIAFAGPFDGVLVLRVCGALVPEIAANMLGLDSGRTPPGEQQRDAFAELLNVICGNLLPVLAGEEAVFDVQPGEVLPAGAAAVADADPPAAARARLELEGGWAELTLLAPAGAVAGVADPA